MCRFFRCRGKLGPGAGKAVSWRRGKVTFIQCRRKMFRFSRRRGKLCPGAGKAASRRRRKVSRANSHAASRRRRTRLNKKAHQSLESVIMNMTCPLCCWGYLLGLFFPIFNISWRIFLCINSPGSSASYRAGILQGGRGPRGLH